jgi:hypothetical protein
MAFVDSDFSAAFDEAGTRYDHGSGRFQWAVNDESMDVILLASTGYWGTDPDLHYALVPMESGALTFPLTQLGFHYNNVDSLTAIAVDLPDGVAEGFDPTRLFGYDNTRYAVWSSWPVFESLLEALLEATEL